MNKQTVRSTSTNKLPWGWLVAAILLCAAAWFLPGQKPNAVLGRLNYAQFYLALMLTLVVLSGLVVLGLPARWRRFVGFRLAAMVLSLLLAVFVLEVVAWLLPGRAQMDNPWYLQPGLGGVAAADGLPYGRPAHLSWRGLSRGDLAWLNQDEDPHAQPVIFQTDRDGFRNRREIYQADLIAIGDSFTEAGNMAEEKTFPFLIGQKLNRSVRNLGRSGYSTPTELIVFKKYGLPSQPRIIIWQVAESNDLEDVVDYEAWVRVGRPNYFDFSAKQKPSRRQAWRGRSPTHRLFDCLRRRDLKPWPFTGFFQVADGREEVVRFLSSPGLGTPARTHPAWDGFVRPLAEAAAICRSNQIQLVMLHIPDKFRVLGARTRFAPEIAAASAQLPGLPVETAMAAALREWCESQKIPFVDATDALQAQAAVGHLVYQPFDTHLSALGHEVVAELISETLRDLLK